MSQKFNKKRVAALAAALAFLGACAFSTGAVARYERHSLAVHRIRKRYKPTEKHDPPVIKETPKKQLDVTPISQYPELPTGCEVTSLAMVLNYNGIDIDKLDLANGYIDTGDVDEANPYLQFVGLPTDEYSFGCYAPVIVAAAELAIDEYGSDLTVTDLTDSELEDLYAYIDRGEPVIVWCTQDCEEAVISDELYGFDWISPEHCVVLVGYSDNGVLVADPLYGKVMEYDKEAFKAGYDALHKQAVVISE